MDNGDQEITMICHAFSQLFLCRGRAVAWKAWHKSLDLNVTMVTSLSWRVTIVSKNIILESFEFMSLNRKTLTFI